jgi:formylglycine-generating enzyme required for sulfatase activity/serine/threonine protein kinase
MSDDAEREVEADALEAWLQFTESPRQGDEEFERLCARHPRLRVRLTELRASSREALGAPAPHESRALREWLERLSRPIQRGARFTKQAILARGGMGVVHRAQDVELERTVALKELSTVHEGPGLQAASRFLEEARITAQLDHPGILPVHELGVDQHGQLYFAMKLVEGRDLRAVFNLVHEGREEWTQTRALGVLLKVCEAMAYAHSKGVIHRDLKPANVMVGGFGEVYVMDWGLARAMGRKDVHDIRLKLHYEPESVHTVRREEREEEPDSPLVTMDGAVVGTPAYMPPEQARGEIHLLSPRSDVYSIGAMLYDLLTGTVPYMPRGVRLSKHTVLARLVEGPPTPITRLAAHAPAELVAIAEKAMARDPERRYGDTLALGADLRAYLEHRVVSAYQIGPWPELSKWVERNRALAGALAAALLALVAGLVASSILYVRAHENELRAHKNELRARAEALAASQRAQEVLRLSAFQELDDLVREAGRLWPVTPALELAYLDWLSRAEDLVQRLPQHEEALAELRGRAQVVEEGGATRWVFAAEEDRWWHDQLAKLVAELHVFSDAEAGLFSAGISPGHGWGVRRRLEQARVVEERTLSGPDARARWAEASASIRAPDGFAYSSLELAPQLGLLPIGRDPDSWLWEFAHLESGEPAERGPDGKLQIRDETGLVFVLLPGGTFRMGAQRFDPARPNFDPRTTAEESPVHVVRLSPYFLSKYEMTQGQWRRLTGGHPSFWDPDPRLPVEQVSWIMADEVCRRHGLSLPSEAQWEYAARGGSDAPLWTGEDLAVLAEVANLAERSFHAGGGSLDKITEDWDDGAYGPARVGRYAPNPFGLHDLQGNVWEWCLDWDHAYPFDDVQQDPVVLEPGNATTRILRGGSFDSAAVNARAAARFNDTPDNIDYNLGFRPARHVGH